MKTFLLSLAAVLFMAFSPVSGQSYYPAGLGNNNLVLWLTASDATTVLTSTGAQATNGSLIKTWKDKSGLASNAIQNTNSARPAFATNQLNGFGAVQFQNDNQYLSGVTGAYQTVVAVRSLPGTGHYQELFTSPANQDFSVRGGGALTTGGASTTYTDGPNSNDWSYNSAGTTPLQWINGVQSLAGSTTNHILVSSAAAPTNSTYSISNVNATAAWMNRGMNGNDPVYELLSYKTTLNNTQRMLLENYEASEWGLTSLLPSSGYTVFTPPSTSTFNKNLVGIGYTSASDNVLSDTVGSTDGFGFSSGSGATDFLNTAGFMMAAHNGQTNTTNTNTTIPGVTSGSGVNDWNRSWYLQKTGGNSTGLVTLNFNFSDYSGTTPSAFYTYYILYNATNGSFSTGSNQTITTVSSTTSGNIVSFKVNANNLPNGYYTIMYSIFPVTLPVTLNSFQAVPQEGSSLLTWSVSNTAAIDHFNIERSTDGDHFSTIGTTAALSGHALDDTYSFVDAQPAHGTNYYRVGIVGVDGPMASSWVVPVHFDAGTAAAPSIYPNPVTDVMHIHMDGAGVAAVRVYTLSGQLVTDLPNVTAGTDMPVPVGNLRTGMYVVEITTGRARYVDKMMKN